MCATTMRVCMYVCTYVCMYAYLYACEHDCMHDVRASANEAGPRAAPPQNLQTLRLSLSRHGAPAAIMSMREASKTKGIGWAGQYLDSYLVLLVVLVRHPPLRQPRLALPVLQQQETDHFAFRGWRRSVRKSNGIFDE